MRESPPGINNVGELERPGALRRRAQHLRQSAEHCEDDPSRPGLLDAAKDLEVEAACWNMRRSSSGSDRAQTSVGA